MASPRKPPSQRNAEYTLERQGRILQSMTPGTLNGRLASAAPTAGKTAGVAGGAGGSGTSFFVAEPTEPGEVEGGEPDIVAPNTPSTPSIDGTTFAAVLRVTWNGLDSGGAAMPADFNRLEVHASTTSGFTPSSTTLVDSIMTSTGGISTFACSTSVPTYVKFVAVDDSGNRSSPSAQASATARRLVDTDAINEFVTNRLLGPDVVEEANIHSAAVGQAQIKNLAVVTAHIGSLDLNSANVGLLSAGKIDVGTLNADITVSARIKTNSAPNARAEMDSTGFHAYPGTGSGSSAMIPAGFYHYNNAGTEDFAADSSGVRMTGVITATGGTFTGTVTVTTGAIQTNTSPNPRVVLTSASSANIDFYTGSSGENPGFINAYYVQPGGGPTRYAEMNITTGVIAGGTSLQSSIQLDSSAPNNVGGAIYFNPADQKTVIISGVKSVMRSGEDNKRFVQGGTFQAALAAGTDTAATGTFDFTNAGLYDFVGAPIVVMTAQANVGYPIQANITSAPSGAGFSWRVQANGTVAAGGITVTVNFMAFGQD